MNAIFNHRIHFLQQGIDRSSPGGIAYVHTSVEACFKELSRTDKAQHRLAMHITQTFRKFSFKKIERKEGDPLPTLAPGENLTEDQLKFKIKMELDDEAIYELTENFIKTMSVYNTHYDEQVRNEILSDSGAMYKFGMWLLTEKIAPFFQYLHES